MNGFKKAVIGSALGVALLAGMAGTTLAADPTPTPGTGWANGGGRGFSMPAMGTTILKKLGMTPEQFVAERQAGKSLADIAKSKGLSADSLTADMLAAKKDLLDKSVKDGRLTQAQADAAYARMQSQVKSGVTRTETGPRADRPAAGLGLGAGAGQCDTPGSGQGQSGSPRMGGRWGGSR
jgi:hypothetical protein